MFEHWPGAQPVKGTNRYSIPASAAAPLCPQYAKLREPIIKLQSHHLDDDYKTLQEGSLDEGSYHRCVDDVAAAIADGNPHDVPFRFDGTDLTLDQLGGRCQAHIDEKARTEADAAAKAEAERAAIEKVYTNVGIKGDRLALFVERGLPADAGFSYAGCDDGPTTAAQMKKAKKLFLWFNNADYTITVARYVFKGDKYKESDRTFDFKESAYAWCR
jgi:hypothetical protein